MASYEKFWDFLTIIVHQSVIFPEKQNLYDLLAEPKEKIAKQKRASSNKKRQKPSSQPINWTEQHQNILENLIESLKSPEIMAFPDFTLPFIVNCDASENGLGAFLYQKQNNEMKVISYTSRTLSPAEKNYHLHSGKLEFLALEVQRLFILR